MKTVDAIIVKVTRRGQTTIPVDIREQCGIKEGDQLLVQLTEKGILFKPIPKLLEMAGNRCRVWDT